MGRPNSDGQPKDHKDFETLHLPALGARTVIGGPLCGDITNGR